MKKNKNEKGNQANDAMLKAKTNQDFNNQKPDPEDPNQNKNHQENGEAEKEGETTGQHSETNPDNGNGKHKGKAGQQDDHSGHDWSTTFPFDSLKPPFG
jgi:hypothetical protein